MTNSTTPNEKTPLFNGLSDEEKMSNFIETINEVDREGSEEGRTMNYALLATFPMKRRHQPKLQIVVGKSGSSHSSTVSLVKSYFPRLSQIPEERFQFQIPVSSSQYNTESAGWTVPSLGCRDRKNWVKVEGDAWKVLGTRRGEEVKWMKVALIPTRRDYARIATKVIFKLVLVGILIALFI